MADILEDIDYHAESARNLVSSYCVSSCPARCCNTGSIVLTSEDEFKVMGIRPLPDKSYAPLDVSKGCPKLSGKLCSVYEKRPKICREFPVFPRGKTLVVAEWCDAVRAGVLDNFFKEMEDKGFKIVLQ